MTKKNRVVIVLIETRRPDLRGTKNGSRARIVDDEFPRTLADFGGEEGGN